MRGWSGPPCQLRHQPPATALYTSGIPTSKGYWGSIGVVGRSTRSSRPAQGRLAEEDVYKGWEQLDWLGGIMQPVEQKDESSTAIESSWISFLPMFLSLVSHNQ